MTNTKKTNLGAIFDAHVRHTKIHYRYAAGAPSISGQLGGTAGTSGSCQNRVSLRLDAQLLNDRPPFLGVCAARGRPAAPSPRAAKPPRRRVQR